MRVSNLLFIILLFPFCLGEEEIEDVPSIEELVFPEGYPLERYEVTTEDGYVLALYRIPHGRADNATRPRPVVYLQHGLLDTSAAFLTNGAPNALGYLFADHGFDVWMGNSRGNTFSNFSIQHKWMKHDEFWDFSLDELAKYDLPASLRFVLDKTRARKLIYLGHSQGTAIAHAMFSMRHPITKRIAVAIMLSPVAFVKHITSHFLRSLAFLDTDDLVKLLGYDQFLPNRKFFRDWGGPFCRWRRVDCADVLSILYGYNPANIDRNRWDTYLRYTPAGASVKLMAHWAQGVRNANPMRFQMYDYGTACIDWWSGRSLRCNQHVYRSDRPPEYNLSRIQVPMVYYSGGHDALADIIDVMNLKNKLSPGVLIEHRQELDYTHLDLIWGIDAKWRVHPYILKTMKKTVRKERLNRLESRDSNPDYTVELDDVVFNPVQNVALRRR